ncbi:MAG TPA: aldehyde dehydrogenase family protein, partial [Puia sp.]|nr:aldehyde dehydrogenase family protein [Puia sp.]
MTFRDATAAEIDVVMEAAWQAFPVFREKTLKERADLMRAIAKELEATGDELIQVAMRETHLPEARLRNERARTQFQLTSYADACASGDWLEVRIDTAQPGQGAPDLRKW